MLLQQVSGISAEAAFASVGFAEGFRGHGFGWFLVEAFIEDDLYGSVPGVVIVQGTFAGCLQAIFPEPFAQGDDSLCSSQVIQHPVSEQDLNEFFAPNYVDSRIPMARGMFDRRKKGYMSIGYYLEDSSLMSL